MNLPREARLTILRYLLDVSNAACAVYDAVESGDIDLEAARRIIEMSSKADEVREALTLLAAAEFVGLTS